MNERIRELAEEAGFYANPDIERFAELIVRECAELAREHNLEKADRSHLVHKAIKQHFGIA